MENYSTRYNFDAFASEVRLEMSSPFLLPSLFRLRATARIYTIVPKVYVPRRLDRNYNFSKL